MYIEVYHNPDFRRIESGAYIPTTIPGDLTLVAIVKTGNLMDALRRTQHNADGNWYDKRDPAVTIMTKDRPIRSTTVGDFMRSVPDKRVYTVDHQRIREMIGK